MWFCVCLFFFFVFFLRGQGTEGLINQNDLVDVALCCSFCALTKKSRRSYCWPETSALRANGGVFGKFQSSVESQIKIFKLFWHKITVVCIMRKHLFRGLFFSSQGPRQNTLNSSLCVVFFFMCPDELVFQHLKGWTKWKSYTVHLIQLIVPTKRTIHDVLRCWIKTDAAMSPHSLLLHLLQVEFFLFEAVIQKD